MRFSLRYNDAQLPNGLDFESRSAGEALTRLRSKGPLGIPRVFDDAGRELSEDELERLWRAEQQAPKSRLA